ncbi:hypothetical protein CEUSTIGMA_g11086.t1 [Chlamydomonas eustigma]|uniref:Elongation factor Tu, chloroplastic n=1 Tax=Chlamydomonas eustigma TaxID=1157962 RepID=A0A250XKP0_9CHLO|nr:hypothetical protein CEUSTIGMA_g11086.t1 [Chlamydomonas eustigma]|eukprot:GAX83661.1 hypothetical protein CEUSTIGMA_g11086.t1 [Chlamydomonas eustigma]
MNVSLENLLALQKHQDRVRNLCVMAHVDHGKTSLSDHLIGSNGLIHPKLQGELRYLDSEEEEQRRGITMKASSIALLYVPGSATRPEGPRSVTEDEKLSSGYLINLIDSPGHVDFCSEVSTAARLSDGAIVVVDAVEGVCIQTHAVLRQAWEEKVATCLFINKVDRLVLELGLTPSEAAQRLAGIVTHANMIMSAFKSEKYMSEADSVLAYEGSKQGHNASRSKEADTTSSLSEQPSIDHVDHVDASSHFLDQADDEEDVFQPANCNVAFGSAHDGWGFRLDQFAAMYAEKLGCKPEALTKALWGDWSFSAKEKRVVRIKKVHGDSKQSKTMFVQFALEPLWKAYSVCGEEAADVASTLGPIVKSRGLEKLVPQRSLEGDTKQALRAVLRAWLPLSEAVLGMAVAKLPGPATAAPLRMSRLLGAQPMELGTLLQRARCTRSDECSLPSNVASELVRLERCLSTSSAAPDAPLLIFVSKMVSVPVSLLPRLPGEAAPLDVSSGGEVFLAIGRVYSGTATPGQAVHVLSPAYSPDKPEVLGGHRQVATLGPLYMMMGRALERLSSVPAGNVLAIAGLGSVILKSATVCSTPCCRPLAPLTFQSAPIVKVAIEPAQASDMPKLVEGLRLLNRADPFVEISVLDSGEHVLGAAGEVHLETCVKDLKERFAKIELLVSPPLVSFRETISSASSKSSGPLSVVASSGNSQHHHSSSSGHQHKVVESSTANGCLLVRVRASPLAGPIASILDDQATTIKRLLLLKNNNSSSGHHHPHHQVISSEHGTHLPKTLKEGNFKDDAGAASLRNKLAAAAAAGEEDNAHSLERIKYAWQLGPKGFGPNILMVTSNSACSQMRHNATSSTNHSDHNAASTATMTSAAAAFEPFVGLGLFEVPSGNVVRVNKHSGSSGMAAVEGSLPGSYNMAGAAALGGNSLARDGGGGGGVHGSCMPDGSSYRVGDNNGASFKEWVSLPLGSMMAGNTLLPGKHLLPKTTIAEVDCLPGDEGVVSGKRGGTIQVVGVATASRKGFAHKVVGGLDGLEHVVASVESGALAGFQMATGAGPLCEEPLWGVCLELEVKLSVNRHSNRNLPAIIQGSADVAAGAADSISNGSATTTQPDGGCAADATTSSGGGLASTTVDLQEDVYGPFSGQVMTAVAIACRRSLMESQPRLTEAMYLAQVQVGAEALSGVYAVLGRRRARILSEEMREGSDTFLVHAYLPVEASFGLADEMRRKCSGAASVSLLLSHWERIEVDPFFVPTTAEEKEEWGEEALGMTNVARRLIDAVRRRKGLPVEEKVVAKATKQRTLKRNV